MTASFAVSTSTSATPTFVGSPSWSPVMLIRPPTAWTRKSYPGRSAPASLPNPVIGGVDDAEGSRRQPAS